MFNNQVEYITIFVLEYCSLSIEYLKLVPFRGI